MLIATFEYLLLQKVTAAQAERETSSRAIQCYVANQTIVQIDGTGR